MKILLAYDGYEHSENALASAATLSEAGAAEVTIVSVVPPDARGSKAGGHVGMRPHAHEDVARGHAYLRERGIESEMRIEHGDPVEEIVRVAREGGYDLIVTGSHGRGPIGEARARKRVEGSRPDGALRGARRRQGRRGPLRAGRRLGGKCRVQCGRFADPLRLRAEPRDPERERRSVPHLAAKLHRSAVRLHDRLDDREA